jgi:hypothetical protein
MRHPFNDIRGFVSQGGHRKNTHKTTFKTTRIAHILAKFNHRAGIFYKRDRCPLALAAVYAKLAQTGGYMEADFVIIGSGLGGFSHGGPAV